MEASSYKPEKYNQWKETIKFFNSKVGQEVSRREHLSKVKHKPTKAYMLTIDTYRGTLINAGYLKHIGRGKYFVIKEIPDVSISMLRDLVQLRYLVH